MSRQTKRRDFLRIAAGTGAGLAALSAMKPLSASAAGSGSSVAGLTVPPLETVRVGFIGVGGRGGGHLNHISNLESTEVVALCDIHEPTAKARAEACVQKGRPAPTLYTKGDFDYRRMLEKEKLDIVIIATPWRWHTPQCVDAMEAGVHAFTEVPAAVTMEECWQLVDTSEKTRKLCMMMENVCYGREELMVLNMCRQGLFGELLHGEGAYIHELRGQMRNFPRGTGSWRTLHHTRRNGNLYPTHGLGPIAQYMNINRGDRFTYLTSMSSPALGRRDFAEQHLPDGHAFKNLNYICGDMNSSLIKTARGRSVLVQHDTTTFRPYNRLNFIQGTKGAFGGFPNRIAVEGRGKTHAWTEGSNLNPFFEEFDHPLYKRMGEEAQKAGGHGGMDFLMVWRFIYCLRNGEPLDQNVYDAAAWSAIGPLSEWSVAHRSNSIDFPDFTRGRWETTEPLGIVS